MEVTQSFIRRIFLILVIVLLVVTFWFLMGKASTDKSNNNEEVTKGPHHGRLFHQDKWALELTIFEQAMPPHFRAYLFYDGRAVEPQQAELTVTLSRFGGKKEVIKFKPTDEYMQSEQVINEPHSFDVDISLHTQDKKFNWNYSTYEGRIKILPQILKAADIETAIAQGQTLQKKLHVYGKILPNRDTLAPIYPRYSGIIKSMIKSLGDEVSKGETLVTIESNESLQNYNITAPINGTVIQKQMTTGELAKGDKPIYEIANLSTVWADLTLYRREASLVKQGMNVLVTGDEGKPESLSEIRYISPLGIEDSQTTLARAVLENDKKQWLPGMYINAAIIIQEKKVAVAIPRSAIQQLQDRSVVFVQQGDYFEASPVELGEEDDRWVEVISGLDSGQQYVIKNSFFLKAELGKEGASHEH